MSFFHLFIETTTVMVNTNGEFNKTYLKVLALHYTIYFLFTIRDKTKCIINLLRKISFLFSEFE